MQTHEETRTPSAALPREGETPTTNTPCICAAIVFAWPTLKMNQPLAPSSPVLASNRVSLTITVS